MTGRKGVQQTARETCYFCGSEGPIETHHIIPNRFDGADDSENLVDLCPTCHERLERLYDDETWHEVRVWDPDKDRPEDVTLSKENGRKLVEYTTSIFTNSDEIDGYPTISQIKVGLNNVGLADREAEYHIEETIQSFGIAEFSEDEDGRHMQLADPIYDPYNPEDPQINVLSEWCVNCESRFLPVYGERDNSPICTNCGYIHKRAKEVAKTGTTDNDDGENSRLEERLKEFLNHHQDKYTDGVPFDELLKHGPALGFDEKEVEKAIEKLKFRGEIYEPVTGKVRVT